mgnify:FL=1|tara:strand:- start:1616 stop:2446 length:831 start_codon:yes stop_codon:yes gene_type:complete
MSKVFKKYAKGNPDADLKVISLGMGVQSTAVYLMSSMGYKLPRADYAIFADPQAEHYKTYDMLKWLLKWKEENDGIEIIVNRDNNIYADQLKVKDNKKMFIPQIPAHTDPTGIARRSCTKEYKIVPVIKTTRRLHKLKPRKRMKPTEMWLGISTDEIERMKESSLYNIKYFYPLIYHGLSRTDCINFFKENNFPVPVKSSCVFCPYHSNSFWAELQKENGDAWKKSVEVDKAIRRKYGMDRDMYLHTSRKPLDEIDFDDKQLPLFEGFDCEGHCGL